MIQKLDFPAAKRLMEEKTNAVLLDVREEDEYISGHAAGAVLLGVNRISRDTAAGCIPSLSTPVLVYCRSGYRSHKAAVKLEALGYQAVYDLGSLAGWPYGIAYGLD